MKNDKKIRNIVLVILFIISGITITIRTVVFSDNIKNYSRKQNIREDKKPIKSAAKICDISSFVIIRTKSEYSRYTGNLSVLISACT